MNCPEYGIFDSDLKQRFGFAKASDTDEIPDLPGIYAWYLPMRGDDGGDLTHFLKTLQSTISRFASVTTLEANGTQRSVQIERNTPEFQFDSDAVMKLATVLTTSQVQQVARLTLMLSFLSEPFYVGMTDFSNGLQSRIRQHLVSVKTFDEDKHWTGSFRTRIAHSLREKDALKRCLVAFVTLPDDLIEVGASRLLEHIIIRTVRPSQSKNG